MKEYLKFYINGEWVDPVTPKTLEVENPATEENFAVISLGSKADVDKAVAAAKAAFPAFSQTTVEYRAELLDKIAAGIQARLPELAEAVSTEMGAPMWLANAAQVPSGMGHFATTAAILRNYKWEEVKGTTLSAQRTDRRLRLHHAVELADQPDRLQSGPRPSPQAAPWC
jgi:aldehyde dehydrogenase (NAD+)